MKLHTAIIAILLLVASTATAGELRFIQNTSGITSHVVYNGDLLPVAPDGTVLLDGHKVPVSILQAASQPQQPRIQPTVQPQMQSSGQWQNPDKQPVYRQPQPTHQTQPTNEYKNTKSATQREIKRETRKIFGNGVGSDIGGGIVNDVLDSIF